MPNQAMPLYKSMHSYVPIGILITRIKKKGSWSPLIKLIRLMGKSQKERIVKTLDLSQLFIPTLI
jgi:hypothetical protein